jgi:hypothetical protein
MERHQYRGYQIETRREWSNWCVSVYPMRAELPILTQPTLHTLTPRKEDAVTQAKHLIDRILSESQLVSQDEMAPPGEREILAK